MNITDRLIAVMDQVGAVHKGDRNSSQNFNFRGIDAVVNAVSPALRANGVVVTPQLISVDRSTVEVGAKRTSMGHVTVVVEYVFHAEGEQLAVRVAAEAMDAGDKATAKAMSVAMRTALLQALCLPTDEPDPAHDSYERSPSGSALVENRSVRPAQKAPDGPDPITEAIATATTTEALDALVDDIKGSENPAKYRGLWSRRHKEVSA